jgi:hypothetical protein
MATVVLVSMVAVMGVNAAQPATVGAPISGASTVCYDAQTNQLFLLGRPCPSFFTTAAIT